MERKLGWAHVEVVDGCGGGGGVCCWFARSNKIFDDDFWCFNSKQNCSPLCSKLILRTESLFSLYNGARIARLKMRGDIGTGQERIEE